MKANVDNRRDSKPAQSHFVGAPMAWVVQQGYVTINSVHPLQQDSLVVDEDATLGFWNQMNITYTVTAGETPFEAYTVPFYVPAERIPSGETHDETGQVLIVS